MKTAVPPVGYNRHIYCTANHALTVKFFLCCYWLRWISSLASEMTHGMILRKLTLQRDFTLQCLSVVDGWKQMLTSLKHSSSAVTLSLHSLSVRSCGRTNQGHLSALQLSLQGRSWLKWSQEKKPKQQQQSASLLLLASSVWVQTIS